MSATDPPRPSSDLDPTIVFRADASARIGRGHLARCGSVATVLRARGYPVVVLTHRLADELAAPLVEHGCSIVELADPYDIEEASHAVAEARTSAGDPTLVVDHYDLDARWQTAMRGVAGRLVAIEDRPIRAHDVDILVDANGGTDRAHRYRALLGDGAQVVTGQDHALIDPAYAERRQMAGQRGGAARRVLVQLGSDPSGLVERVVTALRGLALPGLQVDVVLPAEHASVGRITDVVRAAGWRIHTDVADIHRLYARVDLAIAAPGVSVWERCAMGVPSVVLETTPRHAGAYADLAGSPAITNLGQAVDLDTVTLTDLLGRELAREDLSERSAACLRLVDGRGAKRMSSLLTARLEFAMTIREQNDDDEARLFRWANDPWTREWSFSSAPIRPGEHRRWFSERLADPGRFRQYLAEDGWGAEFGSVRFDRQPQGWTMSVVLAPGYRGRGFAAGLIARSCDRLSVDTGGGTLVTARVRTVRPGAGRALARLGFKQTAQDERAGWIDYRRRWSEPS